MEAVASLRCRETDGRRPFSTRRWAKLWGRWRGRAGEKPSGTECLVAEKVICVYTTQQN